MSDVAPSNQLRRLARRIDVVLPVVLFLLIALPTLYYGYGRDQAIFHVIGRAWRQGLIPFRDTFDVKPPGIYATYAIVSWLGRDSLAGVRVADILLLVLHAALYTTLEPKSRLEPARLAWTTLILGVVYFTHFDYWDSAQSEIWLSAFLTLAAWFAFRANGPRDVAVVGALVAVACLYKFTAAIAGLPVLLLLLREGPRRARAIRLGTFVGAGTAVTLVAVLYWVLHGAAFQLVDVLFGYVSHYVTKHRLSNALVFQFFREFILRDLKVVVLLALGAIVVELTSPLERRDRVTRFLAMAFLFATFSVLAQQKLFPYHWSVAILPATGIVARVITKRGPAGRVFATLFTLVVFLGAPQWWSNNTTNTFARWLDGLAVFAGKMSRDDYNAAFSGVYYDFRSQERIGRRLKSMSSPDDGLLVRGFDPAMYVVSGLSCPSRFVSQEPLDAPDLAYRRDEWAAEQKRALRARPPRFIVIQKTSTEEIEGFERDGYFRSFEEGWFQVLERVPGRTPRFP